MKRVFRIPVCDAARPPQGAWELDDCDDDTDDVVVPVGLLWVPGAQGIGPLTWAETGPGRFGIPGCELSRTGFHCDGS